LLLGALVLAVVLHTHSLFNSLDTKTPTVAAVALDDPKLNRTVEQFGGKVSTHKDPSRLEPVAKVGMVFNFRIPEYVRQMIAAARGWHSKAKQVWQEVSLSIEGRPRFRALVRVRGVSTTYSDKKSFAVDLLSAQQFTKNIRARKFYLLNLLHDPYAFEMRTTNILLQQLGIFPPYNQLAVVTINAEPEGMYLFVERPLDAIQRTEKGVVSVFRIRKGGRIEEKYLAPGSNPTLILQRLAEAREIEDSAEQARHYERLIDIDMYMKWLAANSLLQNGDSGDELFMFEVRANPQQQGRLRFMAWDYDNIQSNPAHPSQIVRDDLLWGAEGPIDKQVVANPVLYDRYRSTLTEVLNVLTNERIHEALSTVRAELDLIDTGFAQDQQERTRQERNAAMAEFMETLTQRRKYLLRLLQS
jgi:spore coat protein CotH